MILVQVDKLNYVWES